MAVAESPSPSARSAVVTGAGAGIGRATSLALADRGWFVVGVELDPEAAAALEDELGDRGAVVIADVTDHEALELAARRAAAAAPLAGWVNNAGLCPRGTTVRESDLELVRRVWAALT